MNDRGFSLIELVIVIVILGIASAGLMSVFSSGMKKSADPLLQNQALHLAQERMDTIIGDRMNPARGYAFVENAAVNYPAENAAALGFPGFSRTTTAFCVAAADLNTSTGAPPCASGYLHATVTVAHAAISGGVTVESLVTDY